MLENLKFLYERRLAPVKAFETKRFTHTAEVKGTSSPPISYHHDLNLILFLTPENQLWIETAVYVWFKLKTADSIYLAESKQSYTMRRAGQIMCGNVSIYLGVFVDHAVL